MSDEDKLVNVLIQSEKKRQEKSREQDPDADEVEAFPEAHYNHYGNRGTADLYLTIGDWDGTLYEIKSESAVRQATGANEIIRQFNKMRKYFFQGSRHSFPTKSIIYELCFTPSDYNFRHIAENAEMYGSALNQDVEDVHSERVRVHVTVRPADPDNLTPVLMFNSGGLDFRNGVAGMDFPEYVKQHNRIVFEEYEDTIREIANP